jgi:hypothetical protein
MVVVVAKARLMRSPVEHSSVNGLNGWAVHAHHDEPGLQFSENQPSALLFGRGAGGGLALNGTVRGRFRLARVPGADLQTVTDTVVVANALLRPGVKG